MKRSAKLKVLPRIALAVSVAVSGVAQAAPSPDAWITTRTKLALFTADAVNATMVHVDTINGRVLLYGKVDSAAQKQRAVSIARGVAGVTSVGNMLEVVKPGDARQVAATDDVVGENVRRALSADTSLAGDHISVKAVNHGKVLLAGDAVSLSDELRAVECTEGVEGVRGVTSEIKSSKEIASYALTPTASEVRESARDNWIIAATKMRFLGDSDVPVLQVGVDASHNVVTLFGIVPSEHAKAAAEADVHLVDSNVVVKNELQVVPAAYKGVVDAKDDLVRQSVEKALRSHPELRKVAVDVKDGVVRLTGTVESGWQRLKAGWIARSTSGVRAVQDDLTI